MRIVALLGLLLVLSGCGAPRPEPLDMEAPETSDANAPPPRQAVAPSPEMFLNDTFALELFAYRNAVSYTHFDNAQNCVKLAGKNLVEFSGVARWTPTSDFTRNLRVGLVTDDVVNETSGPSPLEFRFFDDVERMAATARQVGVLLEGEGFAVKQPVQLELSVRSFSDVPPTASLNPCPAE